MIAVRAAALPKGFGSKVLSGRNNLGEGKKVKPHFSDDIMGKSKQNISLCYQCKKCAAGCPVSGLMQHRNYEVLRLIQLDQKDSVLKSNSPWMCISCKACSSRCPNGIDTAKIMDVLKEEVLASGAVIPEKKIAVFHNAFLETIEQFGRAFELGFIGTYKRKTGSFFQDMVLGLKMMKRNKLNFLPHRIKRVGEVKAIFAQARGQKI